MIGGAAAGYILPMLMLSIKETRRIKQFNDQLADALILAANSLRTGYSFLQAIEMVSREMPAPIGVEFARLQKEISLGVTTEEALANMGTRLESGDLDLVLTAVLIQRQVGGNLAEVLDNIAGTIRERIKLRGEVKTITAQGRVSAIIIGALPFFMLAIMYMLNPKYIGVLFTHPVGNILLGVALAGQVVGMLVLRKIVSVEY
jgi:tight adherence protein B